MNLVRRGLVQSGTTAKDYHYRAPDVSVRMADIDGRQFISGYAVVFNRYSQNLGGFVEQIAPDAFDDSLNDDDQIASFNHDYAQLLGRRSAETLVLTKDSLGIRYDIPFDPDDPDHVRVGRKIARGDLRGSSFSMYVAPDGEALDYTDEGTLLVTVQRASIVEVAPVVWPAYPATEEADAAVHLRSLADRHLERRDEILAAVSDPTIRAALDATPEDAPIVSRGVSLNWARQRLVELEA